MYLFLSGACIFLYMANTHAYSDYLIISLEDIVASIVLSPTFVCMQVSLIRVFQIRVKKHSCMVPLDACLLITCFTF